VVLSSFVAIEQLVAAGTVFFSNLCICLDFVSQFEDAASPSRIRDSGARETLEIVAHQRLGQILDRIYTRHVQVVRDRQDTDAVYPAP
jgi:hypothetical protein